MDNSEELAENQNAQLHCTWLVITTAMPNSSVSRVSCRINWARCICLRSKTSENISQRIWLSRKVTFQTIHRDPCSQSCTKQLRSLPPTMHACFHSLKLQHQLVTPVAALNYALWRKLCCLTPLRDSFETFVRFWRHDQKRNDMQACKINVPFSNRNQFLRTKSPLSVDVYNSALSSSLVKWSLGNNTQSVA